MANPYGYTPTDSEGRKSSASFEARSKLLFLLVTLPGLGAIGFGVLCLFGFVLNIAAGDSQVGWELLLKFGVFGFLLIVAGVMWIIASTFFESRKNLRGFALCVCAVLLVVGWVTLAMG